MIVLDTNVISELLRAAPAPAVSAWFARQKTNDVYLCAVTEAELRRGAAILPAGRRRDALHEAIDLIMAQDFPHRILPFDSAAARHYAVITAARRAAGRPISLFDAQIAAVARAHAAMVATRDVAGFEGCGIEIVNPWQAT